MVPAVGGLPTVYIFRAHMREICARGYDKLRRNRKVLNEGP